MVHARRTGRSVRTYHDWRPNHIGAKSGIAGGNAAKRGGAVLMGYPAVDHKLFAKQSAALKSLPQLLIEFEAMKKEIADLKKKAHD